MSITLQFDPLANPCFTCNLWKDKKNPCIRPKAYKKGGLVFVGEAPGEHEDRLGIAFVGPAGKSLTESLNTLDFPEYTLLNAVCCRPTREGSNRTPSAREVDLCNAFLKADLSLLRPTGIICLGAVAAMAMQLPRYPLKDLRHRTFWVEVGSEIALVEAPEGPRIDPQAKEAIPVWVTYHPAAHMRPGKSNLFKEMQDDLSRILQMWHSRDICTRCGGCGGTYTCPKCGQPNRNPLRIEGLPEDRALTNPSDCAILNLEMREEDKEELVYNSKAPTGPSGSTSILVLDIETTGFLKGYKALPFDKGHILQIGWEAFEADKPDEGDGYKHTEP